MKQAYAAHPQLKAQRARKNAIDQGVYKARAEFMPTITGSYLAEHTRFDSKITGSKYKHNDHEFGLTVTYPLFNGFSSVNRLRKARENSVSGYNTFLQSEQDLLFSTAQAYLSVVRDEAVVRHRTRYVQLVAQEKRAAGGRLRLGDSSRTDVEQAAARLATAQAELARAQGSLGASKAAYKRWVGRLPGRVNWPHLPERLIPANVAAAIRIAFENNPAIRARAADMRAAKYGEKAAFGDLLPKVSLEGSFTKGYRGNLTSRRDDDYRVGVRVEVPIFSGGSTVASVEEARSIAAQRTHELDDTRLAIRESVERAAKQREAAAARLVGAKTAIRANARALEGLRIEFNGGQRSQLDVLNGQRELVESRIEYEHARYDDLVANLYLLAAIGRLAPEHFAIAANRPDVVPDYSRWSLRLKP